MQQKAKDALMLTKNNRGLSAALTPSKQAKAAGCKSLQAVSELTGVSVQTLRNWSINKPELFRIVLKGCAVND